MAAFLICHRTAASRAAQPSTESASQPKENSMARTDVERYDQTHKYLTTVSAELAQEVDELVRKNDLEKGKMGRALSLSLGGGIAAGTNTTPEEKGTKVNFLEGPESANGANSG